MPKKCALTIANRLKPFFWGTPALLMAAALAEPAPVETVIDAAGPAGPLKGVMLLPSTIRSPLALIIPGSGYIDHDGNSPLGLRASTYRLLAHDLAQRGVATVRIDKRGMFMSASAFADANAATIEDYVEDVRVWVATVRQRTGASCIWLIGHSEGGLVAMAAAQDQPGVCGLVLASTPGRRLGEVLRSQIKANPANAPVLKEAMSAIDSLEQGKRVDTTNMHPALQHLFNSKVQGLLISEFSYDPPRLITGYPKPILVLQGQRDIQVSEEDARLLKQAAPQTTLLLLPDVNHVLKPVTSGNLGLNLATYSDPELPLAQEVGRSIGEFILKNSKAD